MEVLAALRNIDHIHSMDLAQKAKIKWSIEGDENLNFFHGILNKKRNQMNIRGITIDDVWKEQPNDVKQEFLSHFQDRFAKPSERRANIDMRFPKTISEDQSQDLEREVSKQEIKTDMSCPICDNAIESTDHLFFRCGLVRDIANKVLSWWNLDHANLNSYAEWKSWLDSIRMDSKLKRMFEGVWYSIWWYVWIYRNKLLFDERKPLKSMLIDNVIASSFYWCKYRSKASFGWNE
ncbi:hypothetical protein Tco_0808588 [Tanacetum coccineum]